MRQHQRLRGHRHRALHQIERSVRHIDNDTAPVAAADHLGAGVGEAAVNRRFGLDVAEFVDPVMGQLQMPQGPSAVGFIDAIRLALQKVRALGRDDRRHDARLCGLQPCRVGDDCQALGLRHPVQPAECELAVSIEFARIRIAERDAGAVGMSLWVGPSETIARQTAAMPPLRIGFADRPESLPACMRYELAIPPAWLCISTVVSRPGSPRGAFGA